MSILSQLGKDLPYEPRQTRWSRIRREQGRCFCGATTYGKSLCPKHLRIQAKRMRKFRQSQGRITGSLLAVTSRRAA